MHEKKHFKNSIRSNEERGKYGCMQDAMKLLWNQDFIRIKKRVQQYVRVGQTFERLDKKT